MKALDAERRDERANPRGLAAHVERLVEDRLASRRNPAGRARRPEAAAKVACRAGPVILVGAEAVQHDDRGPRAALPVGEADARRRLTLALRTPERARSMAMKIRAHARGQSQ